MWALRIVFALDRTYRVNWQFSLNLPAAFFIFCIFPSTPRIAFCSSCDGFRAGSWGQAALGRGGCFSVTIHHPRLGMDGAGGPLPSPVAGSWRCMDKAPLAPRTSTRHGAEAAASCGTSGRLLLLAVRSVCASLGAETSVPHS